MMPTETRLRYLRLRSPIAELRLDRRLELTLNSVVASDIVTFKIVQYHPGLTYIFNF